MRRLQEAKSRLLEHRIGHSHFSHRESTGISPTTWRRRRGKSKFLTFTAFSIERDATLLANRIALLKQEEMKTWKKIEETKKRTKEIGSLKKKNDEKM